jgi:hypothetical protein
MSDIKSLADECRRFAAALPTWQRDGFNAAIDALAQAAQPAAQPAEMTERDQFDLASWHTRLAELADEYYATGSTAPAKHRARAALLLHALDCATGWRARSAIAAAPHPAPAAPTDERALFEAHIAKDCGDLSKFGSGKHIHYCNSAVNNAWTGWQARARIARGEQA